jgi:hypothetical protein
MGSGVAAIAERRCRRLTVGPGMKHAPLALALVCVLTAGCGSSGSASAEVAAVVHHWELAVAQGEFDRACDLLDDRAQTQLKRGLSGLAKRFVPNPSCPALTRFLRDAVLTARQRADFKTTKPSEVSVKDATAKVNANGDFWLSRSNGRWRISELPLSVDE